MGRKEGGGCVLLVGGIVLIGLLMWAVAFALIILACVVALGGLVAGGMIIADAVKRKRRAEEVEAMGRAIAEVADEAARDLGTTLIDLDEFIRSRGVGTPHEATLYANPAAFRNERRRVEEMVARITVAPDAATRLSAIADAEALRYEVRTLIDGEE